MIKAGIIGATGYAGNEIVRLLLGHKNVEVAWYGSRSYIDKKYAGIYQNFFKLVDAKCMDDNMEALADEVDVIFTATPQGLCASLVNEGILSRAKVIDLSADFRIKDVKKYEKWYGIEHMSGHQQFHSLAHFYLTDKFVGGHICQSFYLAVKGRVTHAHLVGNESDIHLFHF